MLPAIKVLAGEMGLPEGNWESLLRANRDLHLRINRVERVLPVWGDLGSGTYIDRDE